MLDGYKREPYSKLGGLVTSVPTGQVPLGSATVCDDIEFTGRSIRQRSGTSNVFTAPNAPSIRGLDMLIQQATSSSQENQMLLAFDSFGQLYKEDYAGAGSLDPIATIGTANLFMQATSAYDKAYMGFSDLVTGQAAPKQYLKYANQFFLDPIGIAPATVAQATAMTATQYSAGDVPQGILYCVVMFMTRSGYITGILDNAVLPIVTTAANQALMISNIPLGPAGTVARILAFTNPGVSSAGPYYYIPDSFTIDGMNAMVTSTVLNDNVSTSMPVNFSVDALTGSTEVTQFFDKMLVPNVVGAKFIKSLKRIAYWGSSAEPSTVFVSDPDDPETIFGTTSRLEVAENNGERVQTVFEYRSQLYVAKERSGYVIDTTNTTPATWNEQEAWTGVGPCGPRALDVCEEFALFVHRSGCYRYEGGDPEWISWEHGGNDGLWKRINWAYSQLISVKIDTETKRVFICVPLDQSTVPNKTLVLDYAAGFGSPVINDYSNNIISADGRKWSIYNLPAYQIVRLERSIAQQGNLNQGVVDNSQLSSQLFLASSSNDGAINMFDTTVPTDCGNPIRAKYHAAFQRPGGVFQLGGFDAELRGNGQLGLSSMGEADTETVLHPINIVAGKQRNYTVKTRGQSTMWALFIYSVNAGDWWEAGELAMWLNPIYSWAK